MTTLNDYRASWERHAACAGTNPHLWYGRDGDHEPGWRAHQRRQRAKAICDTCPVRLDCLADELTRSRSDQHGIRAGTTPGERLRLLCRWRAAGLIAQHVPPTDPEVLRALLAGEARQGEPSAASEEHPL